MEKRYGALRFISKIFKVAGCLIIAFGVYVCLNFYKAGTTGILLFGSGIIGAIVALIVFTLIGLGCFSYAERCMIEVHKEEHLRAICYLMEKSKKEKPKEDKKRKKKARE